MSPAVWWVLGVTGFVGFMAAMSHWIARSLVSECPEGKHDWRPIYGDEITFVGARWQCTKCSKTHPNPVAERPEP